MEVQQWLFGLVVKGGFGVAMACATLPWQSIGMVELSLSKRYVVTLYAELVLFIYLFKNHVDILDDSNLVV